MLYASFASYSLCYVGISAAVQRTLGFIVGGSRYARTWYSINQVEFSIRNLLVGSVASNIYLALFCTARFSRRRTRRILSYPGHSLASLTHACTQKQLYKYGDGLGSECTW